MAGAAPPATGSRDESLSELELAAWRGFLRVNSSLAKELDANLIAEHGLPLSSYEVLLTLSACPPGCMRMSELAESVLLSRSGLTRLIDRLEREGLITRRACPSDARGQLAELTERGRATYRKARRTHLAGVRSRFLAHFSPGELEQLAEMWERILPGAAGPGCDRAGVEGCAPETQASSDRPVIASG